MSDQNPYAPPSADVEVENTLESELAGRWARLGGSILDGIILFIPVIAVMFPLGYWERANSYSLTSTDDLSFVLLYVVFYLLINGYTLATRGQSLGKIIAGTRIVSYSDGKLLPLWKLFGVRFLFPIVLGLVPVIGVILGLVNALLIFGSEKRCGHDYVAGTRVVRAGSLPGKA